MNKFILIIFYIFFILKINADVSATVDRNEIQEGDTFTLTIDTTRDDSDINLDVLNNDFQILGKSSSSQTNIVNYKVSTTSSVILQLSPKKLGKIIIPSISVGKDKTQPITITVVKSSNNSGTNSNREVNDNSKDIFAQSSLSSNKAYVNYPVKLTIKIFVGTSIGNLMLNPSTQSDISIEKFGEPKQYTSNKNGRNYNVLEIQYLITPKQSGLIKIKPFQFSGVKQEMGGFDFDNFSFPENKPFTVNTNELSLHVNAIPDNAPSNIIIANHVNVKDEWINNDNNIKIGEPITRIVTINAEGIPSTSIPNISLNYPTNLNSYMDKAQSKDDSSGLNGTKVFKIVYIPQASGKFVFPVNNIKWLNASTGKIENIKLNSKIFNVTSITNSSLIGKQLNSKLNNDQNVSTSKLSNLTILFIFLWIVTLLILLILLFKRTKKNKSIKKIKEIKENKIKSNSSLTEIKKAAELKNIKLLNIALIHWTNSYFNVQINIIDEINKYILNENLKVLLDEINEELYYSKKFEKYDLLLQILNDFCKNSKNGKNKKDFLDGFYPK